jgi:CheY-like chemotaxis protein
MTDTHVQSDKPPKMLIADDDPSIVKLLAERCANVGFVVETAINGVQALIKANRNHPDIVIIDVNMPEADGLTVCARLLDSSRKSMNVIVVTGSREAETIERCEGFGAFYVRKGPEFWSGVGAALIETFPRMAESIKDMHGRRRSAEVRERPRVLIIDDDLSIKLFLDSRLGKCGVELLHASDFAQAYRIACRDAPSVIVSDYSLANGGVSYLLSRLRTTPATMNVPVLVFTGRNLDQVTKYGLMREVCRKPGVAAVLRKSPDIDELFAALQGLCGFESSRMHG